MLNIFVLEVFYQWIFVLFFQELLHHEKSEVTSDLGVQGYSGSGDTSVLLFPN